MRKLLLYVGCAIVLLSMISGCAGTDEGEKAHADVGTAAGTVDTQLPASDDYALVLDGQPIDVVIRPDGGFEILHLPVGEHVLDVIASDGMKAGRATFRIKANQRTDIPAIRPIPTGQIAGVVTVPEDRGTRALEGAEVIARSDLVWIMEGDQPSGSSGPQPLIYPPPAGITYRAVTDANGAYQMSGVNPGPYLITVVAARYTAAEAFVSVRPGRTAAADFTLRPDPQPRMGTIIGTVVGGAASAQASPIEGALVRVELGNPWRPPVPDPVQPPCELREPGDHDGVDTGQLADPHSINSFDIAINVILTRTDADGHYDVQVPAGRCVVSVWTYGYLPRTKQAVVRQDETTTVDFRLRPVPRPVPPAPPAAPTRP